MISNIKRTILVFLAALALSACNGPFNDYSNYDLSEAYNSCDFSKLTAAGAQRCNNLKKECDKRKADTGFRC